MIWSIAWRNIWRNKVRSIIVMTAVALGLFAGVFISGFYIGMSDMRVNSAIKTEVSHIQMHCPYYRTDNESTLKISNTGEIIEKISAMPGVESCSRRLIYESIITAAHGTRGIKLVGIEPDREKRVTDISDRMTQGSYLQGNSGRTPSILVGQTLAEKMHLKLKSKITVDVIDFHGNVSTKLYKVGGFFRSSNTGYDESVMFVRYDDLLAQVDGEPEIAHEIAIYLKPGTDINVVMNDLKKGYPHLEILSWKELNKELGLITDSMNQYMYLFVLIIMLALCFGIINTMLMAVLERTKELGMLMAVGMNKLRVFLMIILESVFLSLSGGVVGILAGYGVIKYFEHKPIVLEIFRGFEMYGYSPVVYTRIPESQLFIVAFLVVILGVVSAVYPARKATRLDPADAIRTE